MDQSLPGHDRKRRLSGRCSLIAGPGALALHFNMMMMIAMRGVVVDDYVERLMCDYRLMIHAQE